MIETLSETIRLIPGDAAAGLRLLPAGSVHTCVTSPPYYGLRDYGTAEWVGGDEGCNHVNPRGAQGKNGQRADRTFTAQLVFKDKCGLCGAVRVDQQIGLESTPAEFVEKLVGVFREVRRVLRDDGTLWVNIGDSYAGSGKGGNPEDSPHKMQKSNLASKGVTAWRPNTGQGSNLEGGKGTMQQTNRNGVGPVIDCKPKDLIGVPWMLAFALRADGWYLRQDIIWAKPNPMPESVTDRCTKSHEYIFLLSKQERYYFDSEAIAEAAYAGQMRGGSTNRYEQNGFGGDSKVYDTRNKRDVWRIDEAEYAQFLTWRATQPEFKSDVWTVKPAPSDENHFASYPPKLIEPCILAGAPKGGVVLDCFGGTGTTVITAAKLGRCGVTTELSEEYCKIIRARVDKYECRNPGNLFSLAPEPELSQC